ncbi:MAG: LEA type 2 family protein [Halobacteriota archaeon]
MRKVVIAAISVVVIVVVAAVGFVLTLQAPQVEGVSITSIDNVSRSGFTFTFSVKIFNPNIIGITVKDITYNLVLSDTGKLVSNGTSGGAYIQPRGTTELLITSTVFYGSAASTAIQALLSKSIPMDVNGAVTVHPLLGDVQVNFDQSFDAYPLIQNATSNSLNAVRG